MEESYAENEVIEADLSHDSQKLTCVDFPGIVQNVDAAIEKLGGKSALSQAHFEGSRLEVRFRPDDQYCKPAVSKTSVGSSLVLKIKRCRMKSTVSAQSSAEKSVPETETEFSYSAELIGICNKRYQFSGMADYQALPPGLSAQWHNGKPVDPNDFQMKEPLDSNFSSRDIPLFLPPSCFSKTDKPISYGYRPHQKSARPLLSEDSIFVTSHPKAPKSKKYNLAYSLTFDSIGVPKEPNPDAVEFINPNNPLIPLIKEMFEERPIWLRSAIQWRVKVTQLRIRNVLPLIAYNFITGPFKRLWVKLGYDPRADPASKIYQCLDFRVPKDIPLAESHSHGELSISEDVEETTFTFFPDKLPNHRFLCYQLCDIHDPECQQFIHKNDGNESMCSEVNGWCEENTYDKLRKLITCRIKFLVEKNIPDE